jgi:hypothetical protein
MATKLRNEQLNVDTDGTLSSNSDTKIPSQKAVVTFLRAMYPVGTIYTNTTVSTNPATLFGFGTWSAYGAGRVLVSKAESGTFATAGATGGAETHTLTTAQMPVHSHNLNDIYENYAGAGTSYFRPTRNTSSAVSDQYGVTNTGGGGAHNNLQPYIVCYVWERVS